MKHFIIVTTLLILSLSLVAQDYTHTFGRITKADLDLQKVPFDSTAAAVVLFNDGITRFIRDNNGGLDIRFVHTQRIKILEESELDRANFKIYYYKDGYGKTESIRDIKAVCYNVENGVLKRTSIEKSDILEAKHNDTWMVKKIAVPGVKVGSIIELQYTKITPFTWNLPDWEFQSDIPTISTHYSVGMVPFYEYAVISQRLDNLDKFETYEDIEKTSQFGSMEYHDMIYEYGQKNSPAFVDDDFITSSNDYIQKIDFQLSKIHRLNGTKKEIMSTWPDMVKDFNNGDYFGKYIKSAQKICEKSILPLISLEAKNDQEKIQFVSQYMKTNFRFNDNYGIYTHQRAKQFYETKKGSVAEINLFMLGMMRAVGVMANPMILSTRAHGKINSDYPFTSMFNYVAVQAYLNEENFILTDATTPNLPYYLLPIRCLNDHGFVMVKEEYSWINLTAQINSVKKEFAVSSIIDGKLNTRITEQISTYDAWKNRNLLKQDSIAFSETKCNKNESIKGNIKVTNEDKVDATLVIKYRKEKEVDSFDGDFYLVPFDGIEYSKNPLTANKRDYPIDMVYKKQRLFSSTIMLSEGQSFKHIPAPTQHDDELLSLKYDVTETAQFVRVDATYQFKKAIYPPEDYELLKQDFELLYTKLAEQIVISDTQ
ncbi:MAG: DUF3857 and transglutaminase domain-containing protein [Reichenbachiella sp.]